MAGKKRSAKEKKAAQASDTEAVAKKQEEDREWKMPVRAQSNGMKASIAYWEQCNPVRGMRSVACQSDGHRRHACALSGYVEVSDSCILK
jgi:hypothetical protein